MARAGDVLENPATGERLVFLRTAAETGGEVLEYELEFVPRGFAARNHLHPRQEERHEVLDDAADAETPIRVRFASRPALESEALLETLVGSRSCGC